MDIQFAKKISPRRKTTKAESIEELSEEQLLHFGIEPKSVIGQSLFPILENIYQANIDMNNLSTITLESLGKLDRTDKIAFFNAKRFLCFQIAKLLDGLQHPMRKSYQSLVKQQLTHTLKGPYPIFDNISAIFSSQPVITRTATYIYACTEWIDEAFQGKELLHEIYSRLMNPTSISLANHIVDIEAGELAGEYFAWNFNSGMAAIDGILSHLLGYQDILLSSRNIYGGSHQLLNDWFAKPGNLDIRLEWFDGFNNDEFKLELERVISKHEKLLDQGKRIYVFLESPCNPHGYALDVPGISRLCHEKDIVVICDSTVGTPLLQATLKRSDPMERPDYVVHSYTKDLSGSGTTTAGVVIGRNENMFLPKNETVEVKMPNGKKKTKAWNDTLFWNVYYIKGAFLDADKAFEVLTGMKTLELRLLQKCINTIFLAKSLDFHPMINVKCNALKNNENHETAKNQLSLGLPAPLFTIDFESGEKSYISKDSFKRFFDSLEPSFGLQVSLGQTNTVVLCPGLTSHSELSKDDLKKAGISSTTIRIAVGDEDPRVLIAHFINVFEKTFSSEKEFKPNGFKSLDELDKLYIKEYIEIHSKYIKYKPSMKQVFS